MRFKRFEGKLTEMYEGMLRIWYFEKRLAELFEQREVPGFPGFLACQSAACLRCNLFSTIH